MNIGQRIIASTSFPKMNNSQIDILDTQQYPILNNTYHTKNNNGCNNLCVCFAWTVTVLIIFTFFVIYFMSSLNMTERSERNERVGERIVNDRKFDDRMNERKFDDRSYLNNEMRNEVRNRYIKPSCFGQEFFFIDDLIIEQCVINSYFKIFSFSDSDNVLIFKVKVFVKKAETENERKINEMRKNDEIEDETVKSETGKIKSDKNMNVMKKKLLSDKNYMVTGITEDSEFLLDPSMIYNFIVHD